MRSNMPRGGPSAVGAASFALGGVAAAMRAVLSEGAPEAVGFGDLWQLERQRQAASRAASVAGLHPGNGRLEIQRRMAYLYEGGDCNVEPQSAQNPAIGPI